MPYNGMDNDDYVDGEGFCCDDGTIEAAMAQANAPEDNFQEGDAYENLQFYYHTDHLGSSSYITNLDGEVVQHIEYVPFGEVFIEERNNIWNTPYLFNAKEFDEETGLYYYGARYYDPRLSLWMSGDPLGEKNPHLSPYNFVSNNPLNRIDPLGLTDYEVNGEIRTIQDGHNDLRMTVGNADFAKLQKTFSENINSYERFMNELSVKNGYMTSSIYSDTESSTGYGISITAHRPGGQSYSEWSINNNSIYSPYFNVLEGGTNIADVFKGQLNKVNIGNNSKWYFEQNSGRIFNRNQYVTTTPATIKYSNLINGTTIVGGIVTIASSSYDIYQGIVQDGGRYGYNAQVQTAGVIGGYAGGLAGAKFGAILGSSIGSCFGGVGAVPGGIIGGFIGGALGAFGGDYYGEKAAKELLK